MGAIINATQTYPAFTSSFGGKVPRSATWIDLASQCNYLKGSGLQLVPHGGQPFQLDENLGETIHIPIEPTYNAHERIWSFHIQFLNVGEERGAQIAIQIPSGSTVNPVRTYSVADFIYNVAPIHYSETVQFPSGNEQLVPIYMEPLDLITVGNFPTALQVNSLACTELRRLRLHTGSVAGGINREQFKTMEAMWAAKGTIEDDGAHRIAKTLGDTTLGRRGGQFYSVTNDSVITLKEAGETEYTDLFPSNPVVVPRAVEIDTSTQKANATGSLAYRIRAKISAAGNGYFRIQSDIDSSEQNITSSYFAWYPPLIDSPATINVPAEDLDDPSGLSSFDWSKYEIQPQAKVSGSLTASISHIAVWETADKPFELDQFEIESLPRYNLRLKAELDLVQFDAFGVELWRDVATGSNPITNASQGSAALRPFFSSSNSDFNGHGTISGDGNSYMTISHHPSLNIDNTHGNMWFAVVQSDSTGSKEELLRKFNNGEWLFRMKSENGDGPSIFAKRNDGVNREAVWATDIRDGSPHIIEAWYDPNEEEIGIRVDGSGAVTETVTGGITGSTDDIGVFATTGGSLAMSNSTCADLVFFRTFSQRDLERIRKKLADRYAINL